MPWLTPDIPAGDIYISAIVPNTFMPYVVGAIAEMLLSWHWEEFGNLTPDETIDYIHSILDSIVEYENPIGETGMRYRMMLHTVIDGDIVFLTDVDGNPLFGLFDLE